MGLLPVREPQYKAIREWVVFQGVEEMVFLSVILNTLFIRFIFTLSFSLCLSRLNDFYDSFMHTLRTKQYYEF